MTAKDLSYVLVVDDVAFSRRVLGQILLRFGFAVTEAESGLDAIKAIRHAKPGLIFLDYMMPQMSGVQVCEWIRTQEQFKDIPVIICTAHQDRKHVMAAIKAGANDFMCKPVDPASVATRIKKVLGFEV
ncbi:MAG: response regulator [Candidatus Hydrogenedentes bacterium]|nr:response regulator [Candidatus Hydrogenedentota bacterium]